MKPQRHRRIAVGLGIAAVGLASACTPLLPGPPSAATAWSGDATAFLRWTPPATNGLVITGYVITPVVDGAARPSWHVPATTNQTITGLTNGSVDSFRIAAIDRLGTGPAAETHPIVIGTAALTSSSSWLDIVNYARQTSGDAAVGAHPSWVAGLEAHYRYLANTPPALRTGAYASAHTENPASPWFTSEGQAAAASADLLAGDLGGAGANIDAWLASPFHAIGLIRPGLRTSAYASGSGFAGIDVIRGLDPANPAATHPVLLPGPGAIVTSGSYRAGELPSPLDSCPGYAAAGLPIVALLPTAPPVGTTATIRQPDGTMLSGSDLCVITAHNYVSTSAVYGPSGLSVLKDSHAVILLPRTPLQPGRQAVTLAPPGSPAITWTFLVDDGKTTAAR